MSRSLLLLLVGAVAVAACQDADAPDVGETPPPVRVVSGAVLLGTLPEAVGPFARETSDTGRDGALGVQVARATTRYVSGESGPAVVLTVLDVGSAEMAENMGYGWGTGADTVDMETFDGFPVRVVSDPARDAEEVRLLVADRFLVEAVGEGADRAAVEAAAHAVDLTRLAALAGR